jgi:hypothetical protein
MPCKLPFGQSTINKKQCLEKTLALPSLTRGITRRQLLGAPLLLWAGTVLGASELRVVYPGPASKGDTRNDYYWRLLDAALAHTTTRWGPYRLAQSSEMNGKRMEREMARGALDVIARSTSPQLERELLPIRIPLDKGLLGYRVFLIRRELQAKLDSVRTLDDLRHFSIGQEDGWNDIPILEAAGLRVVKGVEYEGLFGMLANGRFDLFSRSVAEAPPELAAHTKQLPDLVIERKLLLYYPFPRYLFVRRDTEGERLATRIQEGFDAMRHDGSFERLFADYREPIERSLDLKSRRLIRIPNPTLTPETPLDRTELWYDPTR